MKNRQVKLVRFLLRVSLTHSLLRIIKVVTTFDLVPFIDEITILTFSVVKLIHFIALVFFRFSHSIAIQSNESIAGIEVK